jgi:hypothetical protein
MTNAAFSIISTAQRRSAVTVRVRGTLDRPGIARLRGELAEWRQAGVDELHLDLSEAATAAPGLARMLAWARTQLSGHGATLIITGANAALRTQLETEIAATRAAPMARAVTGQSPAQPRAQREDTLGRGGDEHTARAGGSPTGR